MIVQYFIKGRVNCIFPSVKKLNGRLDALSDSNNCNSLVAA